jgi:hypothetical protein
MKPDPEKLRTLLAEVLPAGSEHCGPSSTEVLAMLRNERQRQSRLRSGMALVVIPLLFVCALLWQREPTSAPSVVEAAVKSQPTGIQKVNDEQLFALLEGMPAALMKMPDGNSTLFIIEQ